MDELSDRERPHDPLAAWRFRDFRLYTVSRFAAAGAMTLLQAAVAWQVYAISGSALQLGLIGLVRFLPALGMSLVGGAAADSYNRRNIILAAQVVPLLGSLALFAATEAGAVNLALIYGIVLLTALASSFENPARQALLPTIVPRRIFANAIAANSTISSLAMVSGPALGGVLIAVAGVGSAYAAHAGLVAVSLVALVLIRAGEGAARPRVMSVAAVREGLRFVWQRQVLLGAMTLDMFAVIFGGAKALLPVYATDVLQVGAVGYGILSSALEAGALLMSVVLIVMPPIRQTGRALLLSVAAFGVATMAFGLSRSFPLSVALYALVGMADQVSVVMRQTTIQLATPDELRGRVSAVNSVFIGASNQLGMVESGLVAAVTNATFAVVSGGAGCLAVLGVIAAKMPELRRYRTDERGEAQERAEPLPAAGEQAVPAEAAGG